MVGGHLKSLKDAVKKGEHVSIFIQDEDLDSSILPSSLSINIVYEDDYLLIVNKPADVQMMPSKLHPQDTLANRLQAYYKKNSISSGIHFVNRLDTEASGLILVAKNRFIKYLFNDKTGTNVTREYHAILDGILDFKSHCIDLPISKSDDMNLKEVSMDGEECETSYEVVEEYKNFSHVKIEENLGKTIRLEFILHIFMRQSLPTRFITRRSIM